MKRKNQSKSSVILNEEKETAMNTQTKSKSMIKMIEFLFVLLAVLVLCSCAPKAQADKSSCYIDMGMRVTIDVTDVKPRVVFDQLARKLDCDITVSPFILKHITLHVENATVGEVLTAVCPQIGSKCILNENHLTIRPYTIFDKWQDNRWKEFNKEMEERTKILQSRLPEGMVFEDVPLSTVLMEISNASGLSIKPWKDEGNRRVSMDVSGMTVNEALKAVVLYVDGEGAVLIKSGGGILISYSQHWPWGYPPP